MKQEIPIEDIYNHPIVQELLAQIETKDLENIKIPYIIKDKVLMSPGIWNNFYYDAASVKQAYLKSQWGNKEIRSLFLDHADKSSREWIGEVINPKLSGEDVVGDLVIVDKPTAQKLAYGAKMGISPKVHGSEDNNKMVSFLFDNFSVVINPAVKTAYINNMEGANMVDETKPVPSAAQTAAAQAPATVANTEVKINEVDAFMAELCNMTEALSVADIAKKAKEIRKEGEKWADAIQRAAKMMAEEELKQKECEAKAKEQTMASDAIDQIVKMAQILKEKYPYPKGASASEAAEKAKYPDPAIVAEEDKKKVEEAKKKVEAEKVKEQKMEEMGKTIQTLSETVTTLTKKLNEPDKKTEKTAELSESDAVAMIRQNPDAALLSLLHRIG
jgi:hypothetical protein